ncbi:hypothetical protein [Amycolatopsis sp. NPDC049159]|uniref:hypothetical protein n=1 Tax=Amycolatopsis sp. NPDC049159 TaxID=3157210 RepID=UPI0033E524FD
MRIPPIAYAAELEQAATVSACEDQCRSEGYRSGWSTIQAYGHDGIELMIEYGNGIYEMETGHPAAFVLFH